MKTATPATKKPATPATKKPATPATPAEKKEEKVMKKTATKKPATPATLAVCQEKAARAAEYLDYIKPQAVQADIEKAARQTFTRRQLLEMCDASTDPDTGKPARIALQNVMQACIFWMYNNDYAVTSPRLLVTCLVNLDDLTAAAYIALHDQLCGYSSDIRDKFARARSVFKYTFSAARRQRIETASLLAPSGIARIKKNARRYNTPQKRMAAWRAACEYSLLAETCPSILICKVIYNWLRAENGHGLAYLADKSECGQENGRLLAAGNDTEYEAIRRADCHFLALEAAGRYRKIEYAAALVYFLARQIDLKSGRYAEEVAGLNHGQGQALEAMLKPYRELKVAPPHRKVHAVKLTGHEKPNKAAIEARWNRSPADLAALNKAAFAYTAEYLKSLEIN